MESPYQQQPINDHTDRANSSGLSWPERHLRYSVFRPQGEPYVPPSTWASASFSTNSSPHSYHTANTSPLSNLTMNSTSTQSSNLSFPFSVTSINSYKSRKNVLYPRRAHPLPVTVSSEHPVSPDVCYMFSLALSLLLNKDTIPLHIGPNLAGSVPLYNLVAARRDPPNACGKSTPTVIGAPRRFFATFACSD